MTIVVAYPPGGSLDAMARVLAQRLSILRGHSVIVDNRPGFSGNIGAQYVAKAPPNGNVVLMTALTTYSINAGLIGSATAGYDLLKDFEHVAIVGNLPNVMIVPASLPANTLQEFIALARAKQGGLSYATTGNGSLEHVAGEMFKRATGVDMLAVPYKGSTPGVTDLIGGQIQAMFVNTSTAVNNLKGGRIKALGIAAPRRVASLPGVPTLRESGIKLGNDVVSIFGIAAPHGTPKAFVDKLNTDINTVLREADVRSNFENLGIEVVSRSTIYRRISLLGERARPSSLRARDVRSAERRSAPAAGACFWSKLHLGANKSKAFGSLDLLKQQTTSCALPAAHPVHFLLNCASRAKQNQTYVPACLDLLGVRLGQSFRSA